MMDVDNRPRAVFMAFGTKGDVFPIAAIATAFAAREPEYRVVFITHFAHQALASNLATNKVDYIPVSTQPVLSVDQAITTSGIEGLSFLNRKKNIQTVHRQECLSIVGRLFGDGSSMENDFILINFFALEGWHLAELFQVKCIIAAPYVVPYRAPSSFERQFKKEFPLLYKYFQKAPPNTVSWNDILHWMWPLFMEDWGSWRSETLNLSPLPFTDPVTNLPMWHVRVQSPLLLYGFSKEIVEHPGYWPPNIHISGFWFLPLEWQFSCYRCTQTLSPNSDICTAQKYELCENHVLLHNFLMKTSSPFSAIFIGLSSVGSMGFLRSPNIFLEVLKAVLEITDYRFILFSAGYEPLDAVILSYAAASSKSTNVGLSSSDDSTLLFNDRLFCYFGSIPYSWIFSRCAVAIHHGGSGSTAAALSAGIPQIVCPFMLDQFYWAERLHWLGVSPEPLQKQDLLPDDEDPMRIKQAASVLARAIKASLSPEIRKQASKISERIRSEDGVGEALKLLKENVLCSK